MIEDIIMNSCPYLRNWQHQGSCGRLKRSNSASRTWRNNLRAIKVLMWSYGAFTELFSEIYEMAIQEYRYFIRVFISRRMAEVVKERDIWVHSFRMPPDSNNSIKMEVGIEDCLHIEFEYNKSKYVMTNIQFLLSSSQLPNIIWKMLLLAKFTSSWFE